MVLRRRDHAEHSRWPIAEEDSLVALERLEAGGALTPGLWSLTALDTALTREGYQRTSDWSSGDGGACCWVTE